MIMARLAPRARQQHVAERSKQAVQARLTTNERDLRAHRSVGDAASRIAVRLVGTCSRSACQIESSTKRSSRSPSFFVGRYPAVIGGLAAYAVGALAAARKPASVRDPRRDRRLSPSRASAAGSSRVAAARYLSWRLARAIRSRWRRAFTTLSRSAQRRESVKVTLLAASGAALVNPCAVLAKAATR
jgi:hypothetical protein